MSVVRFVLLSGMAVIAGAVVSAVLRPGMIRLFRSDTVAAEGTAQDRDKGMDADGSGDAEDAACQTKERA